MIAKALPALVIIIDFSSELRVQVWTMQKAYSGGK